MDSNTTATITLAGFLAALVHLAHARAAAAVAPGGGPNTAAYTQLSSKLESLLHNCLQPNIYPDIARRVSCGSKLIWAVCTELSRHGMSCLHVCLLLGGKVRISADPCSASPIMSHCCGCAHGQNASIFQALVTLALAATHIRTLSVCTPWSTRFFDLRRADLLDNT